MQVYCTCDGDSAAQECGRPDAFSSASSLAPGLLGSLNESTEEGEYFDSARSSPRFLLSRLPSFHPVNLFIVRRQPSLEIYINVPIERFPYCWILRESVYQLSYIIIILYIYIYVFIDHLNRDIYTRFHKFGESVLGEFNSDMRSW